MHPMLEEWIRIRKQEKRDKFIHQAIIWTLVAEIFIIVIYIYIKKG